MEDTVHGLVTGSPGDLLPQITTFASANPGGTAAIGACLLAALVLAYFATRAAYRMSVRAFRRFTADRPAEDVLTVIAASIATSVAAQGMWQFLSRILGESIPWPLRALMFAFIEISVITSAVRARRNMRENFSAGIDGAAVWALTGLSAVLSSMEASSAPEALFRLAAPLVAAWLWERGMAIERRRLTGRAKVHWRLTPERVFVYLRLAEPTDRTAGEVDAQRRLTRIALAAKKARVLRDVGASPRKQGKAIATMERAYAAAHAHTGLGRDEAMQKVLAGEVASLFSAAELLDVRAASAWTATSEPGKTPEALPGVHLITAGLAKWSQEMLREPAEVVARRDRFGDQDATGRATTLATVIPAPRRRIVGAPGSPWPVGRLVPFEKWTRPEPRPLDDHFPLPPLDAEPVAEPVADGGVVATDPRPVADREKPTDRDRKQAIRFYIQRAKKLNPPSKRTLADWSGFGETWALGCIQEARQIMINEGWSFDDRGNPTAPRPVAEPVATTPAAPSLNGSAPAAS